MTSLHFKGRVFVENLHFRQGGGPQRLNPPRQVVLHD